MKPTLLLTLLFLLGAAAAVQTLSFVLTAESIDKKVYGAAAALVNMTAALSGGVINPIFGIIVAHTHDYYAALWLFPALSLIGIFLALFVLRETYAEKDQREFVLDPII
jgi:MFS family permease